MVGTAAGVGERLFDTTSIERGDLLEPLLPSERHVRREALVLEQDLEGLENSGLVIDDEDGRAASGHHATFSTGMRC